MPMQPTLRDTPLILYKESDNRRQGELYRDNQQTPEALPDGSILKFQLARCWGDDILLKISSEEPTANGSALTILDEDAPATISILITEADLEELDYGDYVAILGWIDPEDGDRWKEIERGQVIIKQGLGD